MVDAVSAQAKEAATEKPKIQVISRASQILRALENESHGLSLGKIAKKVDLARSTVQRIVDALVQEDLLVASSGGTGVRLGPALIRLAAAAQSDQTQIIRPYVSALSARINETVDISVLSGSYAVFIDQVVGKQALRAVSSIGLAMPLWNTAHGKAMLATMDELAIKNHFDFLMRDHADGKTPSFQKLLEELKQIQSAGVGYAREEFSDGVSALGAVIGHLSNNLVAISIPLPSQRFNAREEWLTDNLLEAVAEIKSACGLMSP
jgi:DNA-binding IclR family transcriptional regulator